MFDFTRHWYNVTSLNIKQLMTLLPLRKLIAMKQLTIFWKNKQTKKPHNFFFPFYSQITNLKNPETRTSISILPKRFSEIAETTATVKIDFNYYLCSFFIFSQGPGQHR